MTVHSTLARCAVAALLAASAGGARAEAPPTSASASGSAQRYVGRTHEAWVRDAAIYELNLREFSQEGTLAAAQTQLPRLKALGVRIVWLMPIHPVGRVRPAGPLGSPYAVRDFEAVDPAYGSLDDLRRFVAHAHQLGLKVILDWVADHSAWDNPLVAAHPDWYVRDAQGRLQSPLWFSWGDVVQFDYSSPALRRYMTDAMAYWVREADVDGFRADAAGLVPLDFWEDATAELDRVRPMFMLAEWETRDLSFHAFDATYAWSWEKAVEDIAAGRADAEGLRGYYAWDVRSWTPNGLRMLYVSNHDTHASEGTEYERFGPALDAAIALSVVSDGIPLIYNGQEAGNPKRTKLFEHDPIKWRPSPQGDLYARLLKMKSAHPALWNRPWGGRMTEVHNDDPHHVLSFTRSRDGDAVLAVFNLSPQAAKPTLKLAEGGWRTMETGAAANPDRVELAPWSYRLFTRGR